MEQFDPKVAPIRPLISDGYGRLEERSPGSPPRSRWVDPPVFGRALGVGTAGPDTDILKKEEPGASILEVA